jgi:hypothetical protein
MSYTYEIYIDSEEWWEESSKKPVIFLQYSDIQQVEKWSKEASDPKKSVIVHSGPKAAFCATIIRESGSWKNVTYTK